MKRESRVETYLRQATRGLWGRKRREVREELALHLSERTTAHRIAGLSERDAEERALLELGAPQMVSTGMARIHTLPTVMGSSLALIALCLTVVALWPRVLAQTLPGTFYWPTAGCMKALARGEVRMEMRTCVSVMGKFWIAQKDLRDVLEPQGVVFKGVKENNTNSTFSVTFPGAEASYIALGASTMTVYGEVGESIHPVPGQLSFWYFVRTVALNNDVQIVGWEDPGIRIGDASLHLQPYEVIGGYQAFYNSYLDAVFDEMSWTFGVPFRLLNTAAYEELALSEGETLESASIRVGAVGDEVYGVVTYLGHSVELPSLPSDRNVKAQSVFLSQVLRADDQGYVNIRAPLTSLTFLDTFKTGMALESGDSVLIRLTGSDAQGKGWYEVVSPEMITLEPSP